MISVTRRRFLASCGALLLSFNIPVVAADVPLSPSVRRNPLLNAWLRMAKDGSVTIFPGKIELGQGIGTALAQIVADELDVAIGRISVVAVDTQRSPDEAYTFGSLSIQHSGSAMRQAAAEMRHLLLQNAAQKLDVQIDRLGVDDTRILLDGSPTPESFQGLLATTDFDVDVRGDVVPKSAVEYRYTGTSHARLDIPGKVFAQGSFLHDLRLPGMLHARMVRPPLQGSVLRAVDIARVASKPGVAAIVQDGSFLAVVAQGEEQAIMAATELGWTADWAAPVLAPLEDSLPGALRRMPAVTAVVHETSRRSVATVREISADYSRPYTAHASIGPSVAIATWDDGRLTVWSHGQGMFPLRAALSTVLGLDEQNIRVIHREGAGCYGHNGADDAACDAALIAMRLPGRPVRLQWSRPDEFRYEPVGSAMSVRIVAGLDADDRIGAWEHDVWSGTHSGRPYGGAAAGNLHAAREKEDPMPKPLPRTVPQPTGGEDRNALPLYAFTKQKITKHLLQDGPRATSALRGLGAYANIFAIESFMDELASVTGTDPFDFRLGYLEDERARAVLRSLRDSFERGGDPADGMLSGYGIGFAKYKNLGAYCAVGCEAHINPETGAVRVSRAHAAVDVGLAVNPDGVRNQVEGGIMQSASWTLLEALRYADPEASSIHWDSYPILRFDAVPTIDVSIIDRPGEASVGAGEAAQGPTAAAIGNAIADATGVRMRDLPLTPERVLAALDQSR